MSLDENDVSLIRQAISEEIDEKVRPIISEEIEKNVRPIVREEIDSSIDTGIRPVVRAEIDSAISAKINPHFDKIEESVEALENDVKEIYSMLSEAGIPAAE